MFIVFLRSYENDSTSAAFPKISWNFPNYMHLSGLSIIIPLINAITATEVWRVSTTGLGGG